MSAHLAEASWGADPFGASGPVASPLPPRGKTAPARDREAVTDDFALRTSDLEALWSEAPCGLAGLDEDGRIVQVNQALLTLLGAPFEDVRRSRFASFLTPSTREAFLAGMSACLHQISPVHDLALALERGGAQPIEIDVHMRAEGGSSGLVGLCVVEASRRRERERALQREREEAELFASIVEASHDAIFSVSSAGLILSWNRGAEQLYGYSAMEAIGQPLQMMVPSGRQGESSAFSERVLHGETVSFEAVRLHKDGSAVDVAISGGPIYDRQGRVTGISAVHRDIRGHIRREAQLRFVMRELAHRTKNLLAIIQSIERQTARSVASKEEFHERFSSRLQALAASHDLLVEANWLGALIGDLIERQLAAFSDQIGGRIMTSGPPLRLSPAVAQTVGLAVHELATNATKYGALSVSTGQVAVTWGIAPDEDGKQQFRLYWEETGGPTVSAPAQRGFGSLAIERLAAQVLNGRAELLYAPGGVRWTLVCDPSEVETADG